MFLVIHSVSSLASLARPPMSRGSYPRFRYPRYPELEATASLDDRSFSYPRFRLGSPQPSCKWHSPIRSLTLAREHPTNENERPTGEVGPALTADETASRTPRPAEKHKKIRYLEEGGSPP